MNRATDVCDRAALCQVVGHMRMGEHGSASLRSPPTVQQLTSEGTATVVNVSTPALPERTDSGPAFPVMDALWFLLVAISLALFRRPVAAILAGVATRVRMGSSVKVGQFELGSITSAEAGHLRGATGSEESKKASLQIVASREQQIRDSRGIMIVHRVFRSMDKDGMYKVVIYAVPDLDASLASVVRVEYSLGPRSNNGTIASQDRARGFAVKTSATGPFFCLAVVHLNDGAQFTTWRFVDLEMGEHAPFA